MARLKGEGFKPYLQTMIPKLSLCLYFTLTLLCTCNTTIAQEITVAIAMARFETSPFETQDWIVEIIELDTESGESQIRLSLWGPNALAYPNRIRALSWSQDRQYLALILINRQKEEQLAIFDVQNQTLDIMVSSELNLLHLTPPSWNPDSNQLLFSAFDENGIEQIMQITYPQAKLDILHPGHAPVYSPEKTSHFAFVTSDHQVKVSTPSNDRVIGTFPDIRSLAWSPDGKFLIIKEETLISMVELESQEVTRLFDALIYLDISENQYRWLQIGTVSWAFDSQSIVFTLNASHVDQTHHLSQILILNIEKQEILVQAENLYPLEATPTETPYLFIEAAYQKEGAFFPKRESGKQL